MPPVLTLPLAPFEGANSSLRLCRRYLTPEGESKMDERNFGVNWGEDPGNRPGAFRDKIQDLFEKVTQIDGRPLERTQTGTVISSDGEVGRRQAGYQTVLTALDCGHSYKADDKIYRSPGGHLCCELCAKFVCPVCGGPIPLPGERVFIKYFASYFCRACSFRAAQKLLISAQLGKVQIAEDAKQQAELVYKELKRGRPGLLRRIAAMVTRAGQGGNSVPVQRR
jgi:hypothetical protein